MLNVFVRDFLNIDEDIAQYGNYVKFPVVVIEANVEIVYDQLGKFMPD